MGTDKNGFLWAEAVIMISPGIAEIEFLKFIARPYWLSHRDSLVQSV
jgi:hypothetical protein